MFSHGMLTSVKWLQDWARLNLIDFGQILIYHRTSTGSDSMSKWNASYWQCVKYKAAICIPKWLDQLETGLGIGTTGHWAQIGRAYLGCVATRKAGWIASMSWVTDCQLRSWMTSSHQSPASWHSSISLCFVSVPLFYLHLYGC